jgi:hypothetical protein
LGFFKQPALKIVFFVAKLPQKRQQNCIIAAKMTPKCIKNNHKLSKTAILKQKDPQNPKNSVKNSHFIVKTHQIGAVRRRCAAITARIRGPHGLRTNGLFMGKNEGFYIGKWGFLHVFT